MKRIEFFRNTLKLSLAAGGCFFLGKNPAFGAKKEITQENDEQEKFREEWLVLLLKNIDEQLDKKERIFLMESCGRDCAGRGSTKLAATCRGDVPKLVDSLKKIIGEGGAKLTGNEVSITYDKCYCPIVNSIKPPLSDIYCYCSRGWLLEVFGIAAEKEVEVEILETIKRGGKSCKFIVRV